MTDYTRLYTSTVSSEQDQFLFLVYFSLFSAVHGSMWYTKLSVCQILAQLYFLSYHIVRTSTTTGTTTHTYRQQKQTRRHDRHTDRQTDRQRESVRRRYEQTTNTVVIISSFVRLMSNSGPWYLQQPHTTTTMDRRYGLSHQPLIVIRSFTLLCDHSRSKTRLTSRS